MIKQYDVIIVGGGMVGLTLACALAQQTSLSIAVLESQPHSAVWQAKTYHHRVSALSLSSRRIFQSLNVWKAITEKRVSAFNRIEVWDASGKGDIQFSAKDIAEIELGYIVENNAIQSALEETIGRYPQIAYFPGIKLASFQEDAKAVKLTDMQGQEYHAAIAVAADGANSWLRQQAGIHVDKHDYAQEAIVATVKTELPHQQIARQVFLETGPLAFLPLQEANTSSIVWSLPPGQAKIVMNMEDDVFKQQLAEAFSQRLGSVIHVDQRFTFPLAKQHAKHYVKSRVVLAGDAAHTIHPLAGQGVNMGLLDAVSLVDVMVDAISRHKAFDHPLNLRRYERWRRAENANLLVGVQVIKNIFASDQSLVCNVRNAGLNTINCLSWVRNVFTRHAVGNRDGLPKLALLHKYQ